MEIPYLEYFGLTEKPFGLTPDSHFYFESQTHREALEHLRFFLMQKEGIACIYGDVGTGKTVLSRLFLDSLDKNIYNTALILNPIMGDKEFLQEILTELSITHDNISKKDMFSKLEQFLLEEYKKGKETLIVIDEAQLVTDETFEFIRILSNLETDKEKMIHIILFGQVELIERLKQPHLRYLSQRISVIYRLKTLNPDEAGHYITHRLLKAGSKGFVQFEEDAVKLIYNASRGYPRVINIISDRCLLALYSKSGRVVDEKTVKSVISDESLGAFIEAKSSKKTISIKKIVFISAAVILFILIILSVFNIIPVKSIFNMFLNKGG